MMELPKIRADTLSKGLCHSAEEARNPSTGRVSFACHLLKERLELEVLCGFDAWNPSPIWHEVFFGSMSFFWSQNSINLCLLAC